MADDLKRPWRDAAAMVQARVRGDQAAWTSLLFPYIESFVAGDRQPMANLVGALSQFGATAVEQHAEKVGVSAESIMERWLLWSAENDPDDPTTPPDSQKSESG